MKTFSPFHKATPYPSSVKDLFSFLSEREGAVWVHQIKHVHTALAWLHTVSKL